MSDKVSVVFEALVGSTTKATFQTLTKGFQSFAKGLRNSAKELSKMQQVQAADALGHVAMQVDRLTGTLFKMGKGTTKAKTQLQSLEKGFKSLLSTEGENAKAAKKIMDAYKKGGISFKKAAEELNRLNTASKITAQSELFLATESAKVNEKWKQLIPSIKAGSTSFTQAVTRAKNFGKALQNVRIAIKEGGGSLASFEKKLAQLNVVDVNASNGIKLVGSSFKFLNAQGYKTIGLTNRNAAVVRKYTQSLTTHEKIVNQVGVGQTKLKEALVKVGNYYKNNQMRMDAYAQTLYKAEKAIGSLNGVLRQTSTVRYDALKNINRMALAEQVEAKNLKITANGFTVLNNEGLKPFGNLSLSAAGKLKMLGAGFGTLAAKEKTLVGITQKSATEIHAETTAMWESGKSLAQINAARQKEIVSLRKSINQHEKMKSAASRLKQMYSTELNPLNALNDAQKKSQRRMLLWLQQMRKGKGDVQRLSIAIKEQAKAFQTQAEKASTFERVIHKLANSFKTYGSYMISSQVLMGIANSFRLGTQAIIEHDQALHNLKAIMNATETEARTLDKTMLSVAEKTKFSIGEVGSAMVRFGQAGFSASEAVAGMQDIASLATGTLESLEDTVNLVTAAVRVFHLQMDQTGLVADVFANAVNSSRLTLHKLNIAFNYIGPLAEAAGLSLKDSAASLELLANAGVRASTTGTGLRSVLSHLLNPTTDFKKAIKDAGYEVSDFSPLLNDFGTIVGRLPDVVKDAGDAVKMFGLRGSAVVSAFATQGVSEFNRLRLGLNEIGAASRMAGEQMKGLQNMLKNVSDRFGILANALVKGGVLSGLKVIINSVRYLLSGLTALANTGIGHVIIVLGSMSLAFIGVAGTIRALLKLQVFQFFSQASISAIAFIGNLMQLKWAAATSALQVTKLGDAFIILKEGIIKAVTASLAFMATPIGAAIAAIGAVIAATVISITAYEKHLKKVQEEQSNLASALNTTLSSFKNFQEMVKKYGTGSKEASNAGLTLRASAKKLGKEYKSLTGITNELEASIDKNTGALLNSTDAIDKQKDLLQGEYLAAMSKSLNASTKLYEQQRLLSESIDWLKRSFKGAGQILIATFVTPFNIILNDLMRFNKISWMLLGLIPGFSATAQKMIEKTNEMTDALSGNIKTIDEARTAWTELKKKVDDKTASEDEIAQFKEISKSAEGTAKSLYENKTSLEEWQISLSKKPDALAIVAVTDAYDALKKAAEKAANSVEGQFGKITDTLQTEITNANKKGEKSFAEIAGIFDQYTSTVLEKAAEMYAFQTELWKKESGAYARYKGDQTNLNILYAQKLKEILLESYSAEATVTRKQRAYVAKTYELEIKNLSKYYANKKKLTENTYSTAGGTAKGAFEDELNVIRKKFKTELALEEALWKRKESYSNVSLKNAEQHSQELIQLADERFATETASAKAFIKETTKLNKKELLLEQDKYTAKISALGKLKSAYSNYINSLRGKEASLTAQIKSEVKKREEFQKSQNEKIAETRYSFLTDAQALEERQTEVTKAQVKARKALLSGEAELAKKRAKEAITVIQNYSSSLDPEKTAGYAFKKAKVVKDLKEMGSIYVNASKKIESSLKAQSKSVEANIVTFEEKLNAINKRIDAFYKKKAQMGEGVDMSAAVKEIGTLSTALDEVTNKVKEVRKFLASIGKLSAGQQITSLSKKMNTIFGDRVAKIKLVDAKNRGIEKALEIVRKKIDTTFNGNELVFKMPPDLTSGKASTPYSRTSAKNLTGAPTVPSASSVPISTQHKTTTHTGSGISGAPAKVIIQSVDKTAVDALNKPLEKMSIKKVGPATKTDSSIATGVPTEKAPKISSKIGVLSPTELLVKNQELTRLASLKAQKEVRRLRTLLTKENADIQNNPNADSKTTESALRQRRATLTKLRTAEIAFSNAQVKAEEARVKASGTFLEKAKLGVEEYKKTFQTDSEILVANVKNIGVAIQRSLSQSMLDFVRNTATARQAFRSFAQSVMATIQKTMVDTAVQQFMKLLLGSSAGSSGLLGKAFTWGKGLFTTSGVSNATAGASTAHSGGIIGQDNFLKRMVPSSIFANAPRLHNGLKGDEFPAILQRGEQVVPKDKVGESKPNVAINVINKTSEKANAKKGGMKWDGEKWVINVVLNAMDKNRGGFRNSMRGMMGA